MDENIRFNNNQRPIKLPDVDTPEDSNIIMCGWGKLDTAGYRPVLLRKLSTRVIKNSRCQIQMGRRIYDRQICTYASHGAGACFVSYYIIIIIICCVWLLEKIKINEN